MPIATTLPQNNVTLRYPPSRVDESGEDVLEEYQLLELPQEILKVVEGAGRAEPFPLTIKGTPSDDAVLCTPSSTFLLRQITVSNSLLICRTPPGSDSGSGGAQAPAAASAPGIEIRGTNHHILECVPQAADLERIRRLLRDSQWGGMGSSAGGYAETEEGERERASKRRKVGDGSAGAGDGGVRGNVSEHGPGKRWTKGQLASVVQASQDELDRGLRERNVIEVDGYMLMLAPPRLRPLAQLILTLLTIHMTSSDLTSSPAIVTCPTGPILSTLEDDHDVPRAVVQGVIDLFGEVDGEWKCDVRRLVGQIGLGLVQALPPQGVSVDRFLSDWKAEVGDMWEGLVDLKLLEGNCLLSDPPLSTLLNPSQIITYFPLHALPLHAPTRFADLFLTRQRWRPEEMTPFLRGLTRDGDKKEQDKLIVKFVRVVKDKEGVWWHARRTG